MCCSGYDAVHQYNNMFLAMICAAGDRSGELRVAEECHDPGVCHHPPYLPSLLLLIARRLSLMMLMLTELLSRQQPVASLEVVYMVVMPTPASAS